MFLLFICYVSLIIYGACSYSGSGLFSDRVKSENKTGFFGSGEFPIISLGVFYVLCLQTWL